MPSIIGRAVLLTQSRECTHANAFAHLLPDVSGQYHCAMQDKTPKRVLLVSSVEPDGTLIETIFDQEAGRTALLVARGDALEITPEIERSGQRIVPVNAANNLLKHRAVLLPSEAADFANIDDLAEDIAAYIERYVYLSGDALQLAVGYVLLSWVYDAFHEVPYLRFRGDYGTGKTRALLVVGSITYKPFFASGASTVSPIFHTLNTFRGTLIFDEADFRFSDEKAELVKILNNGNVDGFPVLRTQVTNSKEFDPRAFLVFGPKLVGMRGHYEDRALESRFLTIEMEPGRAAHVPINLPDAQENDALCLRNKLLMYRLRTRLNVRLDPTLADPALEPRMNQILLPLLSVASNSEMQRAILSAAQALQGGIVAERGISSEGRILAVIGAHSSDRLPLATITAAFSAEYGSEYDRSITSRWIGSVLRRLGLSLYKSDGIYVLAPGQRRHIEALCARYGIAVDIEGKNSA